MKHGRKFLLTLIAIGVGVLTLALGFFLALGGKLTGDWVTLSSVVVGCVTMALGFFAGSNAFIEGKAISNGMTNSAGEGQHA